MTVTGGCQPMNYLLQIILRDFVFKINTYHFHQTSESPTIPVFHYKLRRLLSALVNNPNSLLPSTCVNKLQYEYHFQDLSTCKMIYIKANPLCLPKLKYLLYDFNCYSMLNLARALYRFFFVLKMKSFRQKFVIFSVILLKRFLTVNLC